jgi:hypothetical protein
VRKNFDRGDRGVVHHRREIDPDRAIDDCDRKHLVEGEKTPAGFGTDIEIRQNDPAVNRNGENPPACLGKVDLGEFQVHLVGSVRQREGVGHRAESLALIERRGSRIRDPGAGRVHRASRIARVSAPSESQDIGVGRPAGVHADWRELGRRIEGQQERL